jgi:hypothetical protein
MIADDDREWELDVTDYEWKLNVKYSPDQPRVSAGDPRGGQWTAIGAGNIVPDKALKEALDYGNKTGREISISLDESGQEVARDTGGKYDAESMAHQVSLTPAHTMIHNHPKNVPPSLDDMALMFRHQGIQDLYTVTPDGTVYRISRTERTPKNEWPGRVEKEYYKVDDSVQGMREFMREREAQLGRRLTLDEAFAERHNLVMEKLAAVMGLDYHRGTLP